MRLAVALALVIAVRLVAFGLFPFCAEDAYITFHATLDPAWRVAVTSPLWALLCTPGAMPEVMSRFFSLAADVAVIWAAGQLLPKYGFWAFVVFWVSPFFTGSAVSGLEMHAVAALLLVARVWLPAFGLAAMFRPDAALLALCASGRKWPWALAGSGACIMLGVLYHGSIIPRTVTSKLLAYGIHPGAWSWLIPQGFGWESVPVLGLALLSVYVSRETYRSKWLYVFAPVAFLLTHVALGTPAFYWYAVPPLAMLGLAACQEVRQPWHLMLALAVMTVFSIPQWKVLTERTEREAQLWRTGQVLADKNPRGMLLLEPAGMIPYENLQLHAIDDVGLLDPWMARRRAAGAGWRTDAIARYHPQWLVLRTREYVFPGTWAIGPTRAYYGSEDSKLKDFVCVAAPDVTLIGHGWAKAKMVSSNLLVLMRLPGH